MKIKKHQSNYGTILYRMSEVETDTALIFIHGAAGDSRLFHGQLKYFGKKYKTICIDLPCHGKSTGDIQPVVDDHIKAISDVLELENINSYVLIGHSMGGSICLDFYNRNFRNPVAMVLISSGSRLPVSEELLDVLDKDKKAFATRMIKTNFSKNVGLLIDLFERGLADAKIEIIKNDLCMSKNMDYTHVLDKIDVPVLVVANKYDEVVPVEFSSSMAEKIKNCKLVELDLKGHVPFFENKNEFNAVLDSFFEEISL